VDTGVEVRLGSNRTTVVSRVESEQVQQTSSSPK
jgi:hypothetical protein